MNKYILEFFNELNDRDVEYCHFKSNNNLIPAVNGVDDLDLLLGPASLDKFSEVVSRFGMRMAHDRGKEATPYVYHYFGSDPETGLLVHLHVYFKIVTGGSIFKNHWIRTEKMLLNQRVLDKETNVFIPCAEADCILFVIRKMIEQPSPVENFLFYRDIININKELSWLLSYADEERMLQMVAEWLPELNPRLFKVCLDTLAGPSPIMTRVKLGLKMRAVFDNKVRGALSAEISRSTEFVYAYVRGKLKIKRKNRYVFPGGLLVAFVGSEASGKSTLSKDAAAWYGERFDVSHVHMGKPPRNWRTILFWNMISFYSFTKRSFKGRKPQVVSQEPAEALNLPHPLVSWVDSIDRREHLKSCFAKLMQGCTVITDRYPSEHMDGPRIKGQSGVTNLLARWEKSNYEGMPPPDLVIKAVAPLELTLSRNKLRVSPEPEPFVRARYELAQKINFIFAEMITIDTSADYSDSIGEVRRAIWNRSAGADAGRQGS